MRLTLGMVSQTRPRVNTPTGNKSRVGGTTTVPPDTTDEIVNNILS